MLTSNDSTKKKTLAYQAPSQYQTAVQPGMASPSSNLQSPSIPGTVNVAGTQTQIPMRSLDKGGGFNMGPVVQQPETTPSPIVAPQPGQITQPKILGKTVTPGIQEPGNRIQLPDGWTKPNDGFARATVMVDWINVKTGERTSRTLGVAPPPGQGWVPAKNYDESKPYGGIYGNAFGKPIGPDGRPIDGSEPGQPMTLRDAFSTLQAAGHGSF